MSGFLEISFFSHAETVLRGGGGGPERGGEGGGGHPCPNNILIHILGVGLGWVGCVCPPPVLTDPEAPSPKVLWQTGPVVSGSPALDSGLQGHRRPWATRACAGEARHMPTRIQDRVESWS